MDQLGLVEIAGIVFVLAYIGWLIAFFEVVRPRLMQWIGRRLRTGVRESLGAWDAGVYETEDSAPAGKTIALAAADLAVLLLAGPGSFALVGIPAFLLADSGLLHRWEGAVTGTGVRITAMELPVMQRDRATAAIAVRNTGRRLARRCTVGLADYTARNGYLTGSSTPFDLEAGESRTVEMQLDAIRIVPGDHRIRVSLECANRLKDRRPATVRIGGPAGMARMKVSTTDAPVLCYLESWRLQHSRVTYAHRTSVGSSRSRPGRCHVRPCRGPRPGGRPGAAGTRAHHAVRGAARRRGTVPRS